MQSTKKSDTRKIFARRLELALDAAHMKAIDLARSAGLSRGYVSFLISGKREQPSPEVVAQLAAALRVTRAWLTGEEGTIDIERADQERREVETGLKSSPDAEVSTIDAAADRLIKHMDARILVKVLAEYVDELATSDGAAAKDARALVKRMRELRPELFTKEQTQKQPQT